MSVAMGVHALGPPIGDSELDTASRTVQYYVDTPTYLNGPLGGTCHFGYTAIGAAFELGPALHGMEDLMAKKLALPMGAVAVDAGCGFGRVAATLASEHGLRVIGVDLIPARLDEARRHLEERSVIGRVALLNGSYSGLPLPDGSVQGVFTMETLVHADPVEAALAEFWRILEPGGKLVLFEYSVPERATVDKLRQRIAEVVARRTGMTSIERFTHTAFPGLLQVAGFENVTVEDISRNVWPTWRWLFWQAVRNDWQTVLKGKALQYPNLAGSLLIWPNRRHLGYKVVTATKPNEA